MLATNQFQILLQTCTHITLSHSDLTPGRYLPNFSPVLNLTANRTFLPSSFSHNRATNIPSQPGRLVKHTSRAQVQTVEKHSCCRKLLLKSIVLSHSQRRDLKPRELMCLSFLNELSYDIFDRKNRIHRKSPRTSFFLEKPYLSFAFLEIIFNWEKSKRKYSSHCIFYFVLLCCHILILPPTICL